LLFAKSDIEIHSTFLRIVDLKVLTSFLQGETEMKRIIIGAVTVLALSTLFVMLILAPAFLGAQGEPVLKWHTYLGSDSDDQQPHMAVDRSGNVYLAGRSEAIWGNPINPHSGDLDVFVAKLNRNGELEWNTFLGSPYYDQAEEIAMDGSGNVYVVGWSTAPWGIPSEPFPTGVYGAFVAKLNSNGELQWHRFMYGHKWGLAAAVDANGYVYVGGWGSLVWETPPSELAGGSFVVKLDSNGVEMWHALLLGTGPFGLEALAVDVDGNVYSAGRSEATWGNPINPASGGQDGFVAKLNNTGGLEWNTFMGSSGTDFLEGIALDGSGNVYVAGMSEVTWGTPINPYGGGAFAAKLDSSGVRQWHTFIEGPYAWDIAVDGGQKVYFTGVWGGAHSSFVAALNLDGVLQWKTGLEAILESIALDPSGNVYVAGQLDWSWGTPVNPHAGGWDAFVAKLGSQGADGTVAATALFGHIAIGQGYTTLFSLLNTGSDAVIGNLILTGQDGLPLSANLSSSEGTTAVGSSIALHISPGGATFVTATSLSGGDPMKVGWARVESSGGKLGGVATFQYAPSGPLLTVAGVLSSTLVSSATIPVNDDLNAGRVTGYAVANPGSSPITIMVMEVSGDGAGVTALKPIDLAPGKQISQFLYEDPLAISRLQGSAVFVGESGATFTVVALVMVQGASGPLFTTIPVVEGTGITIPIVGSSISRTPASLSQSVTQGQDAGSQSFEVWNSGGGTLNYSISDDAPWLSCNPASGSSTGGHDTIQVNYSTSGLAAGTYNGTITISATGATSQTVVVTLIVNANAFSFWHGSTPGLEFDFIVNPNADGITQITYTFAGLKCGGVTLESGSITSIPGKPWPISNRQFQIPGPSNPKIDIAGTFGNDGTTVTGTWSWSSCSGTWTGSKSTR
jgi:hypothetical protein